MFVNPEATDGGKESKIHYQKLMGPAMLSTQLLVRHAI